MSDKLVISLIPTNFGSLVEEYNQKWNDQIDWVKQSLDQMVKLDATSNNDLLKTPQTKKSAKNKKSVISASRPSASKFNRE